ncbi:enoyl-CoA hydratase-related protein [Mesorhizobium neociceri]|uniref:enoyl-CoA hydratase-related protein n=1 Tax=Mesorhizobium neociceri TaxID=1307853 RepID=UPI001AEF30D4|nr:enoyl-CoA hydratase-related protein [Mesorhizobium neociceri]
MTDLPKLINSKLKVIDRVAMLVLDRDDVRDELTGTALIEDIVRTIDWINAGAAGLGAVRDGGWQGIFRRRQRQGHADRKGSFAGDVYEVQDRYRRGIQRIALAIHRLEVPAIAAINGAAIGAGFDLAMMCDIRIAADHAVFGSTFINLGIIPGDGGAWFPAGPARPPKSSGVDFYRPPRLIVPSKSSRETVAAKALAWIDRGTDGSKCARGDEWRVHAAPHDRDALSGTMASSSRLPRSSSGSAPRACESSAARR